MSRLYSDETDSLIQKQLNLLADKTTSIEGYQEAMFELGVSLGVVLLKKLKNKQHICLAFTVEDADYLAKGLFSILEKKHTVSLVCFWNKRQILNQTSIAPILRKYCEPDALSADSLIIVKSIISGACVVKTNLANLITTMKPENIFVIAPVIHKNAKEKLAIEFPASIATKFQYIYFAEDSERLDNGEVKPGIGGNVYQRLGFKNQIAKNKFTPQLVKQRRKLFEQVA